jgi:transcriptional regulator with XRE-family HTH domain
MLTPIAGRAYPQGVSRRRSRVGRDRRPRAVHGRSRSDREESLVPRTHTSDVTSARLGIEIRRARVDQGLTQAELARRMGVKPPYVAALEAGKRNVTLGQLANIADALERGLDITFPVVAGESRQRCEKSAATTGWPSRLSAPDGLGSGRQDGVASHRGWAGPTMPCKKMNSAPENSCRVLRPRDRGSAP